MTDTYTVVLSRLPLAPVYVTALVPVPSEEEEAQGKRSVALSSGDSRTSVDPDGNLIQFDQRVT